MTTDPTAGTRSSLELVDAQRTGPGTLGGRYMRMFWHPIYRSQDLAAGRARPIRIMSEDFTLYRGASGTPHLVAFRCAHRGTQLSTGWVEGDNLRCFYHGWMYGPDGQCLEQPAEPEPFCQRIRIRSYPVEEYLGLIFSYLGEGDPPPLPRYSDFEREEGREVNIYVRRCNFFINLDNDNIHTYFVHRRKGHDFKEWNGRIPTLVDEEDEWGVTTVGTRPDGQTGVTHRGMPNIRLRKHNPGDRASPREEDSIAWHVPIDDEAHYAIQIDIALRRGEPARPTGATEWIDPNALGELILAGELQMEDVDWSTTPAYARVRGDILAAKLGIQGIEWGLTDKVKVQDVVSQVGQGRIADRTAEHLGRSDSTVILLRKLWDRELRALAEGRPLKQWARPERHVTGV